MEIRNRCSHPHARKAGGVDLHVYGKRQWSIARLTLLSGRMILLSLV